MKRGTHLPCQGHTAKPVAEVGVDLGFSVSKFRGHFPALISSQAPSVASLRAGDLGVFSLVWCSDWASNVQLEGPKAASFIHPSPGAHYQMGGAGTPGKRKGAVHLVMGKGRVPGRGALQEKMSPFCTFIPLLTSQPFGLPWWLRG